MGLEATRYEFGDERFHIGRCPAFISCIGDKPAYWYIAGHLLFVPKSSRFWPYKETFKVIYWNGDDWAISTPKQFETPEAAYAEWLEKASAVPIL